jgi:tRNA A-37 threonylcarbamoyl transferase component Bud32
MAQPTIQRQISASTAQDPERELLQLRLLLWGKVGAALSLLYLVLFNVFPSEPRPLVDQLFNLTNATILGVILTFVATWVAATKKMATGAWLRGVDSFATITMGALVAGYGFLTIRDLDFSYNGVLAVTNLMSFRAALIPSSARRTFRIDLAVAAPMVALAFAHAYVPGLSVLGAGMLGGVLAWCSVSIAISTVISSTIFGLRQRARRAERMGQYELVERIGAGAMGEVYRARHAMLRRPTAIKLLKPQIAGAANIARFEREVQHTAALTHPNTIAIYDYGRTPDGLFYYAMEYLDGTDLQRLVEREGPQPAARVIHILRQVCGSLIEAHEDGLVHRDIKAANVFLCRRGGVDDVVKVLDFGLVRKIDDGGEQHLSGTPSYLAPEIIQEPATNSALADLYAVGVLGYYLITGLLPIDGRTVPVILSRQIGEEPEPPSERMAFAVPADLEALIMRCLEKDPAERPQSARALDQALAACVDAP